MNNYQNIVVKLDGRDSPKQKQYSVDQFQENPEIILFVGSIKAAGVGITLTAASHEVFTELEWVPALHDQAEDREQRIGQKADSINVYYLLGQETIDEDMADIIDQKRIVINKIMDGKETEEESMLSILMQKYKNRRL